MKALRIVIITVSGLLLGAAVAMLIYLFTVDTDSDEQELSAAVIEVEEEPVVDVLIKNGIEDEQTVEPVEDAVTEEEEVVTEDPVDTTLYGDGGVDPNIVDGEYVPQNQVPTDLFGNEVFYMTDGTYFDEDGIWHAPEDYVDPCAHEGWTLLEDFVFVRWDMDYDIDDERMRAKVRGLIQEYYGEEDVGNLYVDFFGALDMEDCFCLVYVQDKHEMFQASLMWEEDTENGIISKVSKRSA